MALLITVHDPNDQRLDPFRWRERQLASKSQRAEKVGAGLFVAEGDLVVQRALDTGHTPVALLCGPKHARSLAEQIPNDVTIYEAPSDVRRDVTGLGVPLDVTGLFQRPALLEPQSLIENSRFLVVLEAIDNPTNVGAIMRSAVALGWDGVLLDHTSADPLARRALRVSMGTALSLRFARASGEKSLQQLLQSNNIASFALTPHRSAVDISHVQIVAHQKRAVLLGSERDGLTKDLLSSATQAVRIPMHNNIDSLNVSVAAAIAMYALGPSSSSNIS